MSLDKAITDNFSGELETAVLSLIYDPIDFYARRLKVIFSTCLFLKIYL